MDFKEILAPIEGSNKLKAASLENIVIDKLSAAQRFEGGNTRLKDFDDLWRISRSSQELDVKKLMELSKKRNVPLMVDRNWINSELIRQWEAYAKRYEDLPASLITVFEELERWLKKFD